jgi:hypothetical protein
MVWVWFLVSVFQSVVLFKLWNENKRITEWLNNRL